MAVRLFTVAIVLFWLGSVAWLCAVVWAPPGSRMTRIDPREAYRVFFEWNDSTTMTLLENGARRGQIRIAGGSQPDPESGAIERVLSLSGSMERFDDRSVSYLPHLSWNGNLAFTEGMKLVDGVFSVRLPDRDLNATLDFAAPGPGDSAPKVQASVTMGGNEILAWDADGGTTPGAVLPLLGSLGPLPPIASLDPASMEFQTEARTGRFTLAGREIRAFLLTFRGEEPGQELRVFLSEAGEPLRIETDLGFEAVSEILVPLEAYKRPPEHD